MRGALARYRHRMPFLLSWITAWWRACPTNFSISFFRPFPCALLALTQSILQGHDERPTVCIHWDGICDSHVPGVHSKTAAYLQIRWQIRDTSARAGFAAVCCRPSAAGVICPSSANAVRRAAAANAVCRAASPNAVCCAAAGKYFFAVICFQRIVQMILYCARACCWRLTDVRFRAS